jgi:phospholipid-binding lipoprotein MlaA
LRHFFALLAIGLAMAGGAARAQPVPQGASQPPVDKHAEARAWAHLLTDFHVSPTPGDPYEQLNRLFFASGMDADRKYFQPISKVYQALTPGLIGIAIHNFTTNLSEPVVIGNDILQLRLKRAADDLARLVSNTTFGVGGIIDFAKRQGLPHRDNDFGVTLGRWGVKPGPYFFLPFLGPTDMRDSIGMGIDSLMSPLTWAHFPGHFTLEVSTTIAGAFDSRIRAQAELEAVSAEATDPYATIRSSFLQSREAMIRGEDEIPTLEPIDEPPPAPTPDGSAAPAPSPSAAIGGHDLALAAADPADAPIATAPRDGADTQMAAAADDSDLPIATARPWDRDPSAAPTRLAGL